MADADVLPLEFGELADTLSDYLEQLHKLADERRSHATEVDQLIDARAYALAADPTRAVGPPEREPAVPQIALAPLEAAVSNLKKSAQAYDAAFARVTSGEIKLSAARRREVNVLLQDLEQRLTDARGLPGRDWFKHLVYAPGMLTGYGVKTLPGVREAIEGGRWAEADEYALRTAQVLNGYSAQLDKATALLAGH